MFSFCKNLFNRFMTLVFLKKLVQKSTTQDASQFVLLHELSVISSHSVKQANLVSNLRRQYLYNYSTEVDVFGSCTLLISKLCTKNIIAANYYYKSFTCAQFFKFTRISGGDYMVKYDIIALYSALHQLYYLLYNCGLEQASIYVLANSYFNTESAALNFFFLAGLQNDFMHYIFEHTNCC